MMDVQIADLSNAVIEDYLTELENSSSKIDEQILCCSLGGWSNLRILEQVIRTALGETGLHNPAIHEENVKQVIYEKDVKQVIATEIGIRLLELSHVSRNLGEFIQKKQNIGWSDKNIFEVAQTALSQITDDNNTLKVMDERSVEIDILNEEIEIWQAKFEGAVKSSLIKNEKHNLYIITMKDSCEKMATQISELLKSKHEASDVIKALEADLDKQQIQIVNFEKKCFNQVLSDRKQERRVENLLVRIDQQASQILNLLAELGVIHNYTNSRIV